MKMFAQIKMSKLKHSAAAAAFGPNERHQKWSTRTRKIKPATGFVLANVNAITTLSLLGTSRIC